MRQNTPQGAHGEANEGLGIGYHAETLKLNVGHPGGVQGHTQKAGKTHA